MRCKIIVLVGFSLVLNSGFGQSIVTDRPDQSYASSVIPKNSFQIEAGAMTQDFVNTRTVAAPNVLLRFGITDKFELRAVNQFEFNYINGPLAARTSGFSDLQLGTKIQLFSKEEAKTEIAVLAHAIIKSGFLEEELGSEENGNFGLISRLAISHSLTERMGLSCNLGYDHSGVKESQGSLAYTLSLAYALNSKIACFIEGYGSYNEFEENETNMDAGVTYLVNDNIQLDYSFGLGLTNQMNFMSGGISWNFN